MEWSSDLSRRRWREVTLRRRHWCEVTAPLRRRRHGSGLGPFPLRVINGFG